jgi:hypothetical protein
MSLRIAAPVFLGLLLPAGLNAQNGAVRAAVATITEADVARRIRIIAHDSMGGRATASPGLMKTAQYVAGEFKRFGLTPGGDSGTYQLSFPIETRRVLPAQSAVAFASEGGQSVSATLAEGAVWSGGATNIDAAGGLVLLAGPVRPDSIKPDDVKGNIVVWLLPAGDQYPQGYTQTLSALNRLGATGVVAQTSSDSLLGLARSRANRTSRVVGDQPTMAVVLMPDRTVLSQVPEAADVYAQLRGAPRMTLAPYPDWRGTITVRDTVLTRMSSPNTVGILEGTDPALKREYIVFSAHMDHVGTAGQPGSGCRAVGADSICNGADDDASGTIGVVELAEAYSRPGARPKRSLIFLTVSGEEQGLDGSAWFANHAPVPMAQVVANINMDMIGRNWKDTIAVIGKEHSDLGRTLNRVNAAHPELKMTAVDDLWPQERFYFRSDHYNFAVKGVPILFFFNGVHPDYHRPSDSADKIDAEKEARILKLIYYLGLDVGNAAERPKWVPASYQQIVQP